MEAHSERWKSLVIMSVLSHRQVMRARIVRTPFIWRTYMPSFDVVSELDKHEVTNAVDNAIKELDRRYDLKGKGTFEFKELTVTLTAEADFQLEAMIEILKLALVKRKIDAKCLEIKDAYASGKLMKQEVILREGIDKELAKKIVAHIKEAKLKVQAAIQGEQVRVTGKKRDDLQEAIAALRAYDSGMPLQFNNFRD
ncbi:UPF0234 protein [Pseudomonas syringae pv. syringae]|nr:UPF0234 protein [Pseudomonas syringae pv. syringae]